MSASETQITALPSSGSRASYSSSSSSSTANTSSTSIPSLAGQQDAIPNSSTNIPEEAGSSTVAASISDTTQASQNDQVPTEENAKSTDLQEPSVHESHTSLERPTGAESSEMKSEAQKIEEGPKYIQPDHFSPLTNNPNGSRAAHGIPNIGDGWLSPEDDPHALRGIPVFKPSMEEFIDFEGYARKTTAWGQYSGIVKVIPPTEWVKSVPPISKSSLSSVRVTDPIQQNLIGSSGLFRIANVVRNKRRPLTVEEWFKKCKDKKFSGPGPKDVGSTTNRDSKEAEERRQRVRDDMRKEKEKRREKRLAAEANRARKATEIEDIKEEEEVNGQAPPVSDRKDEASTEFVNNSQECQSTPLKPGSPTKDIMVEKPINSWYGSFNPKVDWLPEDTRLEDYSLEACVALERRFWKNMGLGEPSWYGADMEGSLFMDEKTPWNVAHLPNLLNRWDLRHLPGVNAPYLYFGMWGASFAWHVEDMDLFSINYIHFGAPKFWYAIPQQQAERFERILQGYFPEDARKCDQFLRHKSFAVSPYRLASDGMRVNMLVHNQGEFVITYPRGYHAGFNMGFNCAESVNFALDSWVELGRRAKACNCVNHSVRIDVDEMLAKDAVRFKGEEELLNAIAEERSKKKQRRRPSVGDDCTPRKRAKPDSQKSSGGLASWHTPTAIEATNQCKPAKVPGKRTPKAVIDISSNQQSAKANRIRDPNSFPCLFCPGFAKDDLLPVFDPSDAVKARWKPRHGEIMAHHSCALAIPGVGIEDREVLGGFGTFVVGVENVESARWKLKCLLCKDKKLQKTGAKIQCTKGKCPRAFHVSCARESDVANLKIWEVGTLMFPGEGEPPLPEDAEVPVRIDIKVELLCPQHNPEVKEKLEQRKAETFRDKVMSIPSGSKIKIKVRTGASLEYTLVEARETTQQVYVKDAQGFGGIFPWSMIDLRPSQGPLLENEYARTHLFANNRRHDQTNGAPSQDDPSEAQRHLTSQEITRPAQSSHSRPLRMDEILNPSTKKPTKLNQGSEFPQRDPVPEPASYNSYPLHGSVHHLHYHPAGHPEPRPHHSRKQFPTPIPSLQVSHQMSYQLSDPVPHHQTHQAVSQQVFYPQPPSQEHQPLYHIPHPQVSHHPHHLIPPSDTPQQVANQANHQAPHEPYYPRPSSVPALHHYHGQPPPQTSYSHHRYPTPPRSHYPSHPLPHPHHEPHIQLPALPPPSAHPLNNQVPDASHSHHQMYEPYRRHSAPHPVYPTHFVNSVNSPTDGQTRVWNRKASAPNGAVHPSIPPDEYRQG
ncbi:specific transcriptional repressor [Cryptococcus neoformans Th84]|nr:specific transcriptional repressor [Cryptococcus neoformans var. grubii Th84]OXH21054.1 specific transcriptional repressor [Cryptococcus neoformans var. grubii]OXH40774.1 specific transcriptional repressor [Cryptococcus neoformans var. grubii]OXH41845.1 specific transcriptional repressor [Cryptococcus neoformans var. grubii]OXH43209.1 specific transcriptional repressor [Cryptococcus neoformans var. grubii]